MASSQVLSAQSSQVIANITVITAGHTAALQNVSLLPRLGQAQVIRVKFLVDATTQMEAEIILYDAAFEDYGLHGELKKKGGKEKQDAPKEKF